MTPTPLIEILGFVGCPNLPGARDLVHSVLSTAGIHASVAVREVETPEQAARERFLGSPTIRVNGRDIEPGAANRTAFVLSCRVYPTTDGLRGLPEAQWLTDALAAAAR